MLLTLISQTIQAYSNNKPPFNTSIRLSWNSSAVFRIF